VHWVWMVISTATLVGGPWTVLCVTLPVRAQESAQPEVFVAMAPEWPRSSELRARLPHRETISVKVTSDGFGNVVEARLLSAKKSMYSDAAVHAASLWKFAPPCPGVEWERELNGKSATLKFVFAVVPAGTSGDELGTAFYPPYEVDLTRSVGKQ